MSQNAGLDRQALNVIQRAMAVSRGEKPSKKHDTKNYLDIHHSSLSKSLSGSILQHLLPGIIAFFGYNLLIHLNPALHPLIAYYLTFILFVIPFELIQILRISKELTGKYIPDHLSHVFVFCPPHSSEYTQQKSGKGSPSLGKRLLNLLVEILRLMRVVHPLTLFMNFMWHFISFSFFGIQEASFYRNTVAPFFYTTIDTLISRYATDSQTNKIHNILALVLTHIRNLPNYLTCYPATLPPLTFQNLHRYAGLVVITIAYLTMPLFEELYYRGLCLPTLVNAAQHTIAKWDLEKQEKERRAKKKKAQAKKNKEEAEEKKEEDEDGEKEQGEKDKEEDDTTQDKKKKKDATNKGKKKEKKGGKNKTTSEDIASAGVTTVAQLTDELEARERRTHGITRAETVESREFLKGTVKSLPQLLLHPLRFALDNTWLMHSFLYSLAFLFVNPWVVISRMVAFVGISQNILSSGILSLSLQVQYLLAIIQYMNLVNKIRGKY